MTPPAFFYTPPPIGSRRFRRHVRTALCGEFIQTESSRRWPITITWLTPIHAVTAVRNHSARNAAPGFPGFTGLVPAEARRWTGAVPKDLRCHSNELKARYPHLCPWALANHRNPLNQAQRYSRPDEHTDRPVRAVRPNPYCFNADALIPSTRLKIVLPLVYSPTF